jgi:hypothetical protein
MESEAGQLLRESMERRVCVSYTFCLLLLRVIWSYLTTSFLTGHPNLQKIMGHPMRSAYLLFSYPRFCDGFT